MRRVIGLLIAVVTGVGLAGVAAPAAHAEGTHIISGWLPYWMTTPSSPLGVTNSVNNADVISDVSPFWYAATPGGPAGVTVGFNKSFSSARTSAPWALGLLRGAGLNVIPAVADGSGKGVMASVLADPAKRSQHVADLVALAVNGGYDGLDLDYEVFAFTDARSTWASTQPNWTAFVTELAAALHAQGKVLSVTIPPPCTTANVCGPQSGYWVYNMTGIAPVVDRIRIMAYDYHVNAAGPIAPLPWVRSMVAYSAPLVTPAKLQVGVPTYGRSWTKKTASGAYQLSGNCPTSGSVYTSLTSKANVSDANIAATLAANGKSMADAQWDPVSAENWIEYDKSATWTDGAGAKQTCTARRIMWWVGPDAVLARTQLVGEFGLSGASLWTIGGDAPEQWPLIRAYAGGLAPASTSVQATVTPAVMFGQPLPVSASVTSNGVPVTGVTAMLQTKRASEKAWTNIATAPINPDGTVAFAPVADRPGSWRVYVPGAPGRAEAASAPAPVLVSSWVRATPKKSSVKAKAKTTVRVVSQPARKGQGILVQQQRGSAWVTVGSGRATAKGVAVVTITMPKAKGDATFRAVGKANAGFAPGESAPFVIRVR